MVIMDKRIFLFALLALLVLPSVANAWSPDYVDWMKRTNHSVSNTSGVALTNYQVDINVTANITDMCVDFCDMRWTWLNTTSGLEQPIDFYIEKKVNSSYAYVWVEVPYINSTGNQTIYHYYNKSSVTTTSNGTATFIFFDDFDDAGFTDKWQRVNTGGSTTQSGGYITTSSSSASTETLESLTAFSYNTSARFSGSTNTSGATTAYTGYAASGFSGADVNLTSHGIHGGTPLNIHGDGTAASYFTPNVNNLWNTYENSRGDNESRFWVGYTSVNASTRATAQNRVLFLTTNGAATSVRYDWVFVRNYYKIEPVVTTGASENNNNPPQITIYSPTNTTYYTATNFNFTFKADDESSTTYTLVAYLDGVVQYNNTAYSDNTNASFLYNFTSAGSHNFTVFANDSSGGTTTSSVYFTIDDYEVTTDYATNPYETVTYNYTMFVRTNFDLVSNVTSQLNWNGTSQGAYDYYSYNSTHITIVEDVTIPLLVTNATSVNHNWNFTVSYVNTSSLTSLTSNNSQTIIFAYYFPANAQTPSDNNPVENDDIVNTVDLTTQATTATFTGYSLFRTQNVSLTEYSYGDFNVTLNVGTTTNTNDTYVINSTITVSFDGRTRPISTENDNVTIHKIILTDCATVTNTTTMIFLLKNEETDAAVNGTIEMFHNVSNGDFNREYNFTFSNVTNATVCINPAFATYHVDSWLHYFATGFSVRDYFLDQEISNVTSTINLYLLENAYSYLSIFFLRDEQNDAVTDAIIQIQRYFVGTNTYKTVGQCRSSNPDGTCGTYLRAYDVYYNYIVIKDGEVLTTTESAQILPRTFESITSNPPFPIPITVEQRVDDLYFRMYGNVAAACTNTSSTVSCTLTDTSGLMLNGRLVVTKELSLSPYFETVCDTNETGSSVVLGCNLGNTTGNRYFYTLYGNFTDTNLGGYRSIPLETGELDFTDVRYDWDSLRFLVGILMVVGFFGIGLATRDLPLAVWLGIGLAPAILYWIDVLNISFTTLMGWEVAVLVIVWGLSRE